MGITGNLKTMQLSELLQWLSLGSKTGTLLIDGHGVEKRIYFQDGRIDSSSSSDQREYLGHFLVSHGFITEEELKMAMEVQEESQILLGKILVMINAIAEADLLRLMRKKAEESIYDVFLWTEGDFEFVDGELPDQKMVPALARRHGHHHGGHAPLRRVAAHPPAGARLHRSSREIMRPLDLDTLSDREKLIVPVHRRPAHDRGDRPPDAQRRVQRLASSSPRACATGTMRLVEGAAARRRAAAGGVGVGANEVEHFLAARPRPAQGGPAGGLPDVQGRLRARPHRRPRRRGDPRGRARDQGGASRRTASRARRSRSSRSPIAER